MRHIGLLAVVVATGFWVSGAAGQPDTAIAGILETNEDPITIDSVMWFFFSQPAPVIELTPGWGGDQNVVDTVQFQSREEWPIMGVFYYHSQVGGSGERLISPVERDTWYTVIEGGDDRARMKLLDTMLTGVAEMPAVEKGRAQPAVSSCPSVGSVSVTFCPGQVTPAQLDILDRTGRVVVRFGLRPPAREHVFVWDGLDSRGVQARSGVYFARLTSPAGSSTVILVRAD